MEGGGGWVLTDEWRFARSYALAKNLPQFSGYKFTPEDAVQLRYATLHKQRGAVQGDGD